MTDDQQLEHVAREFYLAEDSEQPWDQAPADIKREFRRIAHIAIRMVQGSSEGHPEFDLLSA